MIGPLEPLFCPEQYCVTCGPKHAVAITSHLSAFQDPMIHCLDIGEAGAGRWDASLIRSTLQEISPSLIIIAVSYPSWDDALHHNDVIDEVECHCQVTGVPYLQVDVADTTRWQQQAIPVYPIETEQDRAMMDVSEDAVQQETELNGVDTPNLPIKEAERRAGWRKLPQKVRIAIRRLHRQFGHVPQRVLLKFRRSARVSKEYLDAVKYVRCIECEERNCTTTYWTQDVDAQSV